VPVYIIHDADNVLNKIVKILHIKHRSPFKI